MGVQDYRELEVWRQAMDLVTEVYRQTAGFPRQEVYGSTSQLRRAAVSVPSNIAEGQGRRTTKEFLNHLSMARGSLLEVQTQIEIAHRLEYLNDQATQGVNQRITSVVRLLNGLINALVKKLGP